MTLIKCKNKVKEILSLLNYKTSANTSVNNFWGNL